jgi:hypothetical protein
LLLKDLRHIARRCDKRADTLLSPILSADALWRLNQVQIVSVRRTHQELPGSSPCSKSSLAASASELLWPSFIVAAAEKGKTYFERNRLKLIYER